MLRYLLSNSCMSNCTHCHIRLPRSGAECSPNPWCIHARSISFAWRTGASPKERDKIQRAQNVFVSHRGCPQPLLRFNGCLLVKSLQWKSPPKWRAGGLWPLNSPTAISCGRGVWVTGSCPPKTLKIYGIAAAIVKFHTMPSRESCLRCYTIYLSTTKGFRND